MPGATRPGEVVGDGRILACIAIPSLTLNPEPQQGHGCENTESPT